MYLSIDTETTSIDGYMVELAAIMYDECGNILFERSWALDPDCPIHPEAAKVHGYGISKKIGDLRFLDISGEYTNLLVSCKHVLVYSAGFEWRVILREFTRAGLEIPIQKGKLVDVLALARMKLNLKSHKLVDVVKFLGIPENGEFHGALADARYSASVYFIISDESFEREKATKQNVEIAKSDINPLDAEYVKSATERMAPGIESAIPRMMQKVSSWNVNSSKTASGAITMLSKLIESKTLIESARKQYLEPLKSVVSAVEKDVRTKILSPIESAIENLSSKLDAYYTHHHDLAIADRMSEVELASSEEEQEAALDAQDKPIVIIDGKHKITFDYTIVVTDELLVPDIYKSVDIKLISKYLSANPTASIPGVEVKPRVRIK